MTIDMKIVNQITPLFQICQIMKNNNIGSVIVVDKSKTPIDIIIARDIVSNIVQGQTTLLLQSQEVMTTPLKQLRT